MEFTQDELTALIKGFTNKIEEQTARMDALEKMLYEDFLGPAEQNFKDWDHSTRLGEFKERHQEALSPFVEKCKSIENDPEFDLFDKVFSDYDALEEKGDEADYVANVVAGLTSQIEALKSVLGTEEVEITSEGENTTITSDGEEVAKTETIENETIKDESESADDLQKEVDEETISDEDNELADFIKDLENSKELKERK